MDTITFTSLSKTFLFSNKHHPHTSNGSDSSVVIPDKTTDVLAEDKKSWARFTQ